MFWFFLRLLTILRVSSIALWRGLVVLTCLVLSFLVLSCLVLSCLVLPCRVLSCLVLSCLVLSYKSISKDIAVSQNCQIKKSCGT